MRVLLIEDEVKVAAFIQKGLMENGCHVTVSYDGRTGKKMALQEDYDVIILDVMVPYVNGFELCRQLREEQVTAAILMLTALGNISDKVEGFQQGADDYLVKPFHFEELLSRMRAITRRNRKSAVSDAVLRFEDVMLDQEKKTASRNDREIVLTAKEYALLRLFMQNPRRVLSRNYIASEVWGTDFDSSSNVIDVYVNYLRNKIEKGFSGRLIHTIIGMGYIMKET